jgi:hypothetical protein
MMPQPDARLSTGTLVLPRQGPSVPQQGSSAPTPAIAPDRILLAAAAASHAAYRVRVDPGDHALVRRLRDRGPFGPDATAHQQTPSLRAPGYSGVNPWDRTRAAGLKDGSGATSTRTW